jgi:2,5-diketo-D-gluconate reductase B
MKKTPRIGLGTSRLDGEQCELIVRSALDLGYRHIDTAYVYNNQKSVGKGIRGFDRDLVYITSKVMISESDPEKICEESLRDLGVDYLDMYLIHWPDRSQSLASVIEKMEKLKRNGKIKEYGVSNFTISHLKDMMNLKAQIACNQVEFHPYLNQLELLDFCKKNHIDLVAYRPLGKGGLLRDSTVCQISESYSRSPAQILLRWLYQKQISFVVKSSTQEHLRDNLGVLDFFLKDCDVEALDQLDRNQRFCDQPWSDFKY